LQQMEIFLSIVGCGAGGRELRFRRLEPLMWVFGKKGGIDAYGYVCFGDGGGGSESGILARQRLLKRVCCMQKRRCYAKMADTQLGLLGGY
jgi:hypothetical protein